MNNRLFSRRSLEGYLLIDHRESPGLTPEELQKARMNPTMPVGSGQKLEAPTYCCSHCDRIVVMNPLRTRERAHCIQCDRDCCDDCGVTLRLTGECTCRQKRIDTFLAAAEKPKLIVPAS